MKKTGSIMIAVVLGLCLFSATSCRQQQECEHDLDSLKKESLISRELFKVREIFCNEKDVSKIESSLSGTIERIIKIRRDYNKTQRVEEAANRALFACYSMLAYVYKCQDDDSAYRLVIDLFLDESPQLTSWFQHDKTMGLRQLFEHDIISNAGIKNTVWNELDRQLQNDAYENAFKQDVEYFMEKLGVNISLKGGMGDFHEELEAAIMREGLENVVTMAKIIENRGSGIIAEQQEALGWLYSISTEEEQHCISIRFAVRFKRTIATFTIYIYKDIDGKLKSCSIAITKPFLDLQSAAPSECPQG
jgi:hypothetical protein